MTKEGKRGRRRQTTASESGMQLRDGNELEFVYVLFYFLLKNLLRLIDEHDSNHIIQSPNCIITPSQRTHSEQANEKDKTQNLNHIDTYIKHMIRFYTEIEICKLMMM